LTHRVTTKGLRVRVSFSFPELSWRDDTDFKDTRSWRDGEDMITSWIRRPPMNIALNESLEEVVRRRAEAAGYSSPDAYVEAVIRADLERTGEAVPETYPELSPETQAAIREGLDSGPGVVADEAFWAERYCKLAERQAGA
jgi:Arc/MetJ-type ribon-helix-helix transcriptional regulator